MANTKKKIGQSRRSENDQKGRKVMVEICSAGECPECGEVFLNDPKRKGPTQRKEKNMGLVGGGGGGKSNPLGRGAVCKTTEGEKYRNPQRPAIKRQGDLAFHSTRGVRWLWRKAGSTE